MSTPQFSRPGAFDLSSLAAPAGAPGGAASAGATGAYVLDVTSPDAIAEVAEASVQHLVLLSLWSPQAPTSVALNEVLTRLSDSYAGRFLLARVDVDAVPQVAAAVGAEGVPFVVALLGGQPVAQVPPSADETALRGVLDQLLQAAVTNGVTGRAVPRAVAAQPPDGSDDRAGDDPRFAEADAALGAGDIDAAITAYQNVVTANPMDHEASERLAGVKLMRRTAGADPEKARAAAAGAPDDVDAQLLAADLDVVVGSIEDAFARLVDTVRRTSGDERDRVRTHLLELFEIVGVDDPRVGVARRNLSMALF
jgi:putative thioredoxin